MVAAQFIREEAILPGMTIEAISGGTKVSGTVETALTDRIIFTNGLVLYLEDGWSFRNIGER